MTDTYRSLAGTVGSDPTLRDTKLGPDSILRFRVAERTGYGDEDTRWWTVAVFNSGLIHHARAEVWKGLKVALEGRVEVQQYNGQDQYNIIADKLGIIEYFAATKKNQSAPAAAPVAVGTYTDDL